MTYWTHILRVGELNILCYVLLTGNIRRQFVTRFDDNRNESVEESMH